MLLMIAGPLFATDLGRIAVVEAASSFKSRHKR
jgi:hypothetical protein